MNNKAPIKERIWELDFLRGLTLLVMICWHLLYDLKEFYGYNINLDSGLYFYIARVGVVIFILISGISSMLSRSNVKRGFKVLLCAICITIISYLFNPDFVILFGILHFFGISMIISPAFKGFNKYILIVLGTILILFSIFYIPEISASNNLLFPFGIKNEDFHSSDYYPLLPWFGVFLYGIMLSKTLYKKKRSILKVNIKYNFVNLVGRNTLLVYMAHQPLITAALAIINYFFKISHITK